MTQKKITTLGSVGASFSSLLSLKKCQSRREARRLVVPNKQRVTQSGAFSGSTRRAGTLFVPHCVASRLCSTTTLRSLRLVGHKKRLQQ